jgi:Uma2 family endonuclease
VFSSALRIRVTATGLASYPDVSVVYGALNGDAESPDTVTNPAVLVEVLSDSTMEYDLSEKFEHYRRIESLKEVVYVWQNERRIEVRRRETAEKWGWVTARAGDTAWVASLGCELVVDEVYREAAPAAGKSSSGR